ncbi:MAG TPA: RNA polymerase sigma factor [Vicinamibacterales bacterium]|nr:RNA polymerase sigma factor [Vicinamibacterales bacterium]
MHELVGRLASSVEVDEELEREFEVRLVESSTLAFRVAYSVLRHREDAEDVAQECFARAFRAFHQLRDRERFRAWLVRMTWRLALDRRRGDRRREARELAHAATVASTTASETVDAGYRSRELWRAIDTLPDKLRIALVLASIEGHDLAEVASLLRLPIGTVKSRLFLARRRLKEQLQWIR